MGFREKLDKICISADKEAKRQLARHTGDLAVLVAAVLRSRRWMDLSLKTRRRLDETGQAACDAADLADAAEYTNDRLLDARYGLVVDLTLKRDLRAMQDQIYVLFESKKAPERGFVYVAWSGRPERFMYVGKASQVERLRLSAHGKLAHAAAQCTRLSLLFPTQSLDSVLSGLEASICKLVEHWCNKRPELNDRIELVPPGRASSDLADLAIFLGRVAKRVDAYV